MRDKEKEEIGDNLGLWESILKEVATEKRNPDATVLVLGRPGVGKRALMQALFRYSCASAAAEDDRAEAQNAKHSRAVGLDYAYFGARDPGLGDDATDPSFVCPSACSALILEDARHEALLLDRLNLTMDGMRHCTAMVCLDLKEPWTMMEDLRRWLEVLQRLMETLMQKFTMPEQDELRARVINNLAQYRENSEDPEFDGGAEAAPPALEYNLGIPLIVVVTRADGASALETPKTVGWSETIEAFLRNECLSYGAAIVYTQCQGKTTTVDVLYDYLMHRVFDYPLTQKACLPSRDALFVPSGWDTQDKVNKTASSLQGGLERSFESVVVSLEPPAPTAPPLDECEDMETFLKASALVLQKQGGVSAAAQRKEAGGGAAAAAAAAAAGASAPAAAVPKAGEAAVAAGGGAAAPDSSSPGNFFQALLARGQPGAAKPGEAAPAGAAKPAEGAPAVSVKVPEVPKK